MNQKRIRKIVKLVTGLFLVVILGIGGLFASVFIGNKPLEDGAVLNGHGITVNDGYSGAFLLPAGEGQFVLVDCGNDAEANAVKGALQKRGATPESVVAIFLTHGHPDHIAGCKAFRKATVYGFEQDAAMAAGKAASTSPMGRIAGVQRDKTVVFAKMLADSTDVQVGDLSVRAYHVPGHTQGSGVFLARGVLYVGDSLTSTPDNTLIDPPWLFSEDKAQNAESIAGLVAKLHKESADVKTIALSHTGAVDGPGALDAFVTAKGLGSATK